MNKQERQTNRDISYAVLFSKWIQQLGQDQVKATNQELRLSLPHEGQRPMDLGHSPLLIFFIYFILTLLSIT